MGLEATAHIHYPLQQEVTHLKIQEGPVSGLKPINRFPLFSGLQRTEF